MPDSGYTLKIHADPGSLPAQAWDALLAQDPNANPFVSHAYLNALHTSGAASPEAGWLAQFLTLWRGDALVAGVPLYAKGNSYGEYVFDWSWADAQERMGIAYYPKWLVAVPFTPVGGTRLLAVDAAARAALADALLALVRQEQLSSLHVLFAPPDQIQLLSERGMLVRTGVQFHWRNQAYADFAHFLEALAQPKRKKIRAERRKVQEAGIRLEQRCGTDIREADWDFFFRCYENTYLQHGSPPYLNRAFFGTLASTMPEHLLLVLAYDGQVPVASALGIYDRARGTLYGRYWGALVQVSCLHFECCYYQMIDFAIREKLQVFEGGAQGAHKLARGLDPVATASVHWLREPPMHAAVARFLARERTAVQESLDELGEHRALRAGGALTLNPSPGPEETPPSTE